VAGTLVALLASGCGREEIRVYRVAKADEASSPARLAAAAASPAPAPAIHWSVPEHWTPQEAGSSGMQMRVGSYLAKGPSGGSADISVIPLQGDSGTELGNVNRWRGQMGLAPVEEGQLASLGQTVTINGRAGTLYDFTGTPPGKSAEERMLIARSTEGDTAWFYKITGDSATVGAERAHFIAFLESVHFHADGDTSHGGDAYAPAKSAASAWKIPGSWTEVAPGMMQQAKFIAKGDGDAQAEVTLSIFPGEAGGLLPNVNRWRGQIQLAPITEDELRALALTQASPSGPLTVLDMKNPSGQRLVAAILKRGSETWYFKFMGADAVIERERAAFLRFSGQPQ
jgi:hypothetical protein